MKKIFVGIILIFFNINNLFADDRTKTLDRLFNDLKINNTNLSSQTEQKIWKIWSTHPSDNNLTSLLSIGSDLVYNNEFSKAIEIFNKVIEIDPNWAEAWNKRATIFYMIGEFEKSQKDIDQVLKLEKRHFGALAGQGLVNIKLKNYEKAIQSYKNVMEIYPSMHSPKIMINHINELIKKQSI